LSRSLAARALLAPFALLASNALAPRHAAAEATFVVESSDASGAGFDDPTPTDPVGGNDGTTLGEQRLIAVQYAADLWGAALDSAVPVVISASFADLGCASTGATTLASASAAGLQYGIDRDGSDPGLAYPDALANRLRGSDFAPGEPDILASFNGSVDDGCLPGIKWYYGLDADHGQDQDLVTVALHELAHGLGVQVFVDATTGQPTLGVPSAYSTHVLDLDTGKRWSEMTNLERVTSYANARRVVWTGNEATQAAADSLLPGRPEVLVTPNVAPWSGLASDASFGGPLTSSVSAPLYAPASGCPDVSVAGKIVLLRDGCAYSSWAAQAATNGALGVLASWQAWWSSPPVPVDEANPVAVGIPVLSISPTDADHLAASAKLSTLTVSMSLATGFRGTDALGRVLLNATTPADTASSISHWDELGRPNLLMEPVQKPVDVHALDITPAMLRDIGWARLCGNARLDQSEDCDDGEGNSDDEPNACRTNCELPRCGDGVEDDGEECDEGDDNSQRSDAACRLDCTEARCGDGVRDSGEDCDDGLNNNDSAPDACRTDCSAPRCGDGVVDAHEECDDADDNSDLAADACRSDCSRAHCGDGVIDDGETCDDADDNSDDVRDACRTDCAPARCGDGVRDSNEGCDQGRDNRDRAPNACRTDCTPARCGDGVVDDGELCDRGDDGGNCTSDCPGTKSDAGRPDAGDAREPDDVEDSTNHAGCGCRLTPRSPAPRLWWLGLFAVARLARRRRR